MVVSLPRPSSPRQEGCRLSHDRTGLATGLTFRAGDAWLEAANIMGSATFLLYGGTEYRVKRPLVG